MTMVGFDVAKNTVVAAVLDAAGTIVEDNIVLSNDDATLADWLRQYSQRLPSLGLACESTGYYHQTLTRVAINLGITCQLINPLLTSRAIKGTIRGKKTDRTDAVLIARMALRGEGYAVTSAAMATMDAVTLLRTSVRLRTMAVQIHMLQASLRERRVTASEEITTALASCEELLRKTVAMQRAAAAKTLDQSLLHRLQTIPGIGPYTASVVVSELRDVQRFRTIRQLIGFSGLDPRVRQSGTSLNRNTRLTKRGSAQLRRSIFVAANSARQADPQLRAYYQGKRAAGRTHTEATVMVSRKLLARIYAVWKEDREYVVIPPDEG